MRKGAHVRKYQANNFISAGDLAGRRSRRAEVYGLDESTVRWVKLL
jgi:hypothetical protein